MFGDALHLLSGHLARCSRESKLVEETDTLDSDDRYHMKRKAYLDERFYWMYDKTEAVETQFIERKAKEQATEV